MKCKICKKLLKENTKNNNEFCQGHSPLDSGNRYSKIHILFRELAKAKGVPDKVLYPETLKVKQYWKDFLGIKTLTKLSDEELRNTELIIEARIKGLKAQTDKEIFEEVLKTADGLIIIK